ncbi:hypothetical protein N7520_009717 [Penicillium odoratum]|uniref:uncharacterized protein n=1 Tax=Penicillium odoratum TaxID=1167516 RepID=UPI002546C5A8|nr:uncharacterized protein N7520_009717 [Penicillium odoratum]KAJ5752800.1 hypothetical protein N7520_009717 [Penicillium odoratum]
MAFEIMIAMHNISPMDIFRSDTHPIWVAMEEYLSIPDLVGPDCFKITKITLLLGEEISLPVPYGFDHPPRVMKGYIKSIRPAISNTLSVLTGLWIIEAYTVGFHGIRTYEGYLDELLAWLA